MLKGEVRGRAASKLLYNDPIDPIKFRCFGEGGFQGQYLRSALNPRGLLLVVYFLGSVY